MLKVKIMTQNSVYLSYTKYLIQNCKSMEVGAQQLETKKDLSNDWKIIERMMKKIVQNKNSDYNEKQIK